MTAFRRGHRRRRRRRARDDRDADRRRGEGSARRGCDRGEVDVRGGRLLPRGQPREAERGPPRVRVRRWPLDDALRIVSVAAEKGLWAAAVRGTDGSCVWTRASTPTARRSGGPPRVHGVDSATGRSPTAGQGRPDPSDSTAPEARVYTPRRVPPTEGERRDPRLRQRERSAARGRRRAAHAPRVLPPGGVGVSPELTSDATRPVAAAAPCSSTGVVKSCTLLASPGRRTKVATIEAMAGPDGELHPLQDAFRRNHGLQCGYCTPA